MATITTGLKKRGSKNLYDGNYPAAVECFFRAYMMDAEDTNNVIDTVYALNQNSDYVKALTFAYALLGEYPTLEKKDSLYFLCAEAFGGAGCIEGCAQMLERCLKVNPEGPTSKDAQNFLNELKQKYEIDVSDSDTDAVAMTMPNSISDAPFLNYETLLCMRDVSEAIKEHNVEKAIKRIDQELDTGNVTVSLLGVAIMMGAEAGDTTYIKRNAERFRFIEDYTVSELMALAYNLSDLNDDDVAYTVYRELYNKESGERDIAFGFAVACERIGENRRAAEITSAVLQGDGGIGPASYYINEIGTRSHSYMLKYEGECEQNILKRKDEGGYTDNRMITEAIDYFRFTDISTATQMLEKLDENDLFTRLELRRAAIEPKVNLVVRARAAAKVSKVSPKVFLNTGSDIIEFTPEMESVINNFFERGLNETVN
jgi:tetratricopeptide (TPR) repeat protein